MRISHKHKFIFLATPHTGSTTTRKVLDEYSDVLSVHITQRTSDFPFYHHISAKELKSVFEYRGWAWDEYVKFCFVRNPYDRVVSLYHHKLSNIQSRKTPGVKGALRKIKNSFVPPTTFQQYVSQIDVKNRLPTSIKSFAFYDAGKCLVDGILKFECLRQELPEVLEQCGIEISADEIPYLNASARRSAYRSYYDEETKERVGRLYRYEIDRFGYTF